MDFREQMAKQQAQAGVVGGVGSAVLGGALLAQNPAPPPDDTIASRIGLACRQASELKQRIGNLAAALIGSIPSAEARQGNGASCLLDVLDLLARDLQEALNEIDRLQGRI